MHREGGSKPVPSACVSHANLPSAQVRTANPKEQCSVYLLAALGLSLLNA